METCERGRVHQRNLTLPGKLLGDCQTGVTVGMTDSNMKGVCRGRLIWEPCKECKTRYLGCTFTYTSFTFVSSVVWIAIARNSLFCSLQSPLWNLPLILKHRFSGTTSLGHVWHRGPRKGSQIPTMDLVNGHYQYFWVIVKFGFFKN